MFHDAPGMPIVSLRRIHLQFDAARGVTWGEIGIIARNAAANSRPIIEVFMIEFPFLACLALPRPANAAPRGRASP
jgi:hypothetical protein